MDGNRKSHKLSAVLHDRFLLASEIYSTINLGQVLSNTDKFKGVNTKQASIHASKNQRLQQISTEKVL